MRHTTITLRGPYRDRDMEYLLRKWGIPATLAGSMDALVHFRDAGWAVFTMPPMVEVARYARKACRHPGALTALVALARVALHSQLDLAEAVALIRWLVAHCPATQHPQVVGEWRGVAVLAVDVMHARWSTRRGIASQADALAKITALRDDLDDLDLANAERRLRERRALVDGRRGPATEMVEELAS